MWSKAIGTKKKGLQQALTKKLGELLEKERDDDNLVELIDTKIQLSLEIEKDEIY